MLFFRLSRSIGAQKTGLVYHLAEISGSQGFASNSSAFTMTNVSIHGPFEQVSTADEAARCLS